MKKIFQIIGIVAVLLVITSATVVNRSNYKISTSTFIQDGMTYMVVYSEPTTGSTGIVINVSVVNLTKDKLEVQLLQKQLK
jgi:uncharacterized protein YxeA